MLPNKERVICSIFFNHLQVLHLTFACISLQIIFKLNQGNWHGGVVQQYSRHFFVLLGSSLKIMKNQVNVTFKQIKTCISITIPISQNIAKKKMLFLSKLNHQKLTVNTLTLQEPLGKPRGEFTSPSKIMHL